MKIKIYQINQDRDKNDLKFMGLDFLKKRQGTKEIDPAIYDEVFSGEVDCGNLEDVFSQFNSEGHPLMRGHSLSVSDVVVKENGAFFCGRVGFEKVDFDERKTQKPDNLIKGVFVQPGKAPYVAEVANTLEAKQRAVGGLIQCLYNDDGTIIVCNDEGKIMGLPGNRRIEGDILAGNFLVLGEDGENFRSLTDEEQQKYLEKFAEVEDIDQKEVEGSIFAKVIILG